MWIHTHIANIFIGFTYRKQTVHASMNAVIETIITISVIVKTNVSNQIIFHIGKKKSKWNEVKRKKKEKNGYLENDGVMLALELKERTIKLILWVKGGIFLVLGALLLAFIFFSTRKKKAERKSQSSKPYNCDWLDLHLFLLFWGKKNIVFFVPLYTFVYIRVCINYHGGHIKFVEIPQSFDNSQSTAN